MYANTVYHRLIVVLRIACEDHQYACTNGRCIHQDEVCDGVEDCPLGDDEDPSVCSKQLHMILSIKQSINQSVDL